MDPGTHESLDGQVALVTGATRGIGLEIANGLAARGATVYAGARDTGEVTDGDRRAVELDVTRDGTMRAAVERIVDGVPPRRRATDPGTFRGEATV